MDCVKELLIRGCAFDVVDNFENTCLHYSAQNDKSAEILQLLIKYSLLPLLSVWFCVRVPKNGF